MADVNDDVLDSEVRHQIHVLRLRNGIVGRMLAVLERVEVDALGRLLARLEKITKRGFDLGPATTERLERAIVEIQQSRAKLIESAGQELTSELDDFLLYERDWQINLLAGVVVDVGLNTTAPTLARARAAAFSKPFETRLLRDWVKDLTANDQRRIRHAVQNGYLEGLTTPQIGRSVQDVMDTTRRHAQTIARTATNHVANAARKAVGQANADIIKGVRYVATLDSRTSAVCRGLDGKVFPIDSGPRPPQHMNCRSTITYILKGIPGNTGTRSSFRGQVPAELTYNDWLRKQPKSFVIEVLGKKKADLYLKGRLSLDRFTDKSGQEYTLADLRRREPEAFKRAD